LPSEEYTGDVHAGEAPSLIERANRRASPISAQMIAAHNHPMP